MTTEQLILIYSKTTYNLLLLSGQEEQRFQGYYTSWCAHSDEEKTSVTAGDTSVNGTAPLDFLKYF